MADVATHRYRVTMTVPAPAAETVVSLPVWIPGSYMIREFARNIVSISARRSDAPSTGGTGK